jgi:CheY-like chemotaxis protein
MDISNLFMPVGVEIGTNSSKFCCQEVVLGIRSIVGSAMDQELEWEWAHLNDGADQSWVNNLAVFDPHRKSWFYIGQMADNSSDLVTFTEKSLRDPHDILVMLLGGLFLLDNEMSKNDQMLNQAGICLGAPSNVLLNLEGDSKLADFLEEHLVDGALPVKVKNALTGEVCERVLNVVFVNLKHIAYGAYTALLYSKFEQIHHNVYIIDVGHDTWMKLPIVGNEAMIAFSQVTTGAVSHILKEVIEYVHRESGEHVHLTPEILIEKVAKEDYLVDTGREKLSFVTAMADHIQMLAEEIHTKVIADIETLLEKGSYIDYFLIVGGGSHLLFETLKRKLQNYHSWDNQVTRERVFNPIDMGLDPRYITSVGFMFLAGEEIKNYDSMEGFEVVVDRLTDITGGLETTFHLKKGGMDSVLVVSDDELFLTMVADKLSYQYNIYTASSFEGGLEEFEQNSDIEIVLISSYLSGGQSGVDFAYKIKSKSRISTAVLMADDDSGYSISKAVEDGAVAFCLTGSPKEDDLRQVIKHAISMHQSNITKRKVIADHESEVGREMQEMARKLQAAFESNHNLLDEINRLQRDIQEGERKVENFKMELDSKEQDLVRMKEQVEDDKELMKGEYQQLEGELKERNDHIKGREQEMVELLTQVDQHIKRKDEEVRTIHKSEQALKRDLASLEDKVKYLNEGREMLLAQMEQLNSLRGE